MADLPGRPAWEPEDRADPAEDRAEAVDRGGWGSPVPAEYGSLHAVRPPARKQEMPPAAGGLFSAWARTGSRRPADPAVPASADPAGAGGSPAGLEAGRDGEGEENPRLFRRPTETGRRGGRGRRTGSGYRAAPAARREPVGRADFAVTEPAGPTDPADRPQPAVRTADPAAAARPDGAARPDPGARLDPAAATQAVPVADPLADPWGPASEPAPWPDMPAALPADPGLADATLAGADMVAPVPGAGPGGPRPASTLRRPVRRPGRSRSRVVIRHIDVATVAKVSVLFWLLTLVVVVVAAVLLWAAADSFGTLPSIDKSVRTLFSLRKFRLEPGAVAMYTAAAGLVIAVVGTLASILLALIYNLIADVVGGIRVELESLGRE
ncbi:MAG TPA: DUF3566 domain-containing protein [Acidimicrobiales bacterium]|nr:DUF3566 domain-containing protein [Acidimicrobiales bacterium]